MAFLADAVWMLVLLIPCLAAVHFGVFVPEERHLEESFGDEFRAYRRDVRRWI